MKNNILWSECLKSVPGHGEEVVAWSLWVWAEGLPGGGPLGAPQSDLACLEHGTQKRLPGQRQDSLPR